jgi:hypothetical protein
MIGDEPVIAVAPWLFQHLLREVLKAMPELIRKQPKIC